jgi:hypothetical protein
LTEGVVGKLVNGVVTGCAILSAASGALRLPPAERLSGAVLFADVALLAALEAELARAEAALAEIFPPPRPLSWHFGNERGTAIAIVSIRHNLAVMGYRTGIQSRHLS